MEIGGLNMRSNDKGVIEYLSREGRRELAELIIENVKTSLAEERKSAMSRGASVKPGRLDVYGEVAARLNVHRSSLHNWMRESYQASNPTANRLIELAKELDPSRAFDVIEADLENSKSLYEKYLRGLKEDMEINSKNRSKPRLVSFHRGPRKREIIA
jgi:hypothetical protein